MSHFTEKFDVAICCEVIEHILDDRKLMKDIALCIKPGGRLLLTTPYFMYRPMTRVDLGPFSKHEDGGHVRRGYTRCMLEELCRTAGLVPESISYRSGFFSQRITASMRVLNSIRPFLGWIVTSPFRILPPLLDGLIATVTRWPCHCICLEAYKPRYPGE